VRVLGGGPANGSYRGESLLRRSVDQLIVGRIDEEAVVTEKIHANDGELDISKQKGPRETAPVESEGRRLFAPARYWLAVGPSEAGAGRR
jgi:hypothetical protein